VASLGNRLPEFLKGRTSRVFQITYRRFQSLVDLSLPQLSNLK
jgi:hypothetical protein